MPLGEHSVKFAADIFQSAVNNIIPSLGNMENIDRKAAVPVKLYFFAVLGELVVEKNIDGFGLQARFGGVFRDYIPKGIETVDGFKIIKRYLRHSAFGLR